MKKKKTHTVSLSPLRVEPELKEKLKKEVERTKETQSTIRKRALRAYLQ